MDTHERRLETVARSPPESPGRRILWAEDDAQDRMLILEALQAIAHPGVTLVPDGAFLLQALRQGRPDLVVTDLNMPGLGGIEALRQIRSHPDWKALPVVVFSSDERPEDLERCRALGVADLIAKPVGFDRFSAAVQRIVRLAGTATPSSRQALAHP